MRRRLRRFAAVSAVVTAFDFAVLLALSRGSGVAAVAADVIAVVLAALASYLLHRTLTFGDDPHIRWVNEPSTFAWIGGLAAVLDVLVFESVATGAGGGTAGEIVVAKVAALAVSATWRGLSYRAPS